LGLLFHGNIQFAEALPETFATHTCSNLSHGLSQGAGLFEAIQVSLDLTVA